MPKNDDEMPISYGCSRCLKALRVDDSLAGGRVPCKAIGKVATVPIAVAADLGVSPRTGPNPAYLVAIVDPAWL